jgi:GH15 family glucan-1,4-alpha-glucosidase
VAHLLIGLGLASYLDRRGEAVLVAPGVALTAQGAVQELGTSDILLPGTRVLAEPGAAAAAATQRAWLDRGRVPSVAGLGSTDLFSQALLDLYTLSLPYGVAVAAWPEAWRFVWPRDAAFVATAMARTGRLLEARRTLSFLQAVQAPSGEFQARYAPDGSGPPDNRGAQHDGIGWSLWALGEVTAQIANPAERRRLVESYRLLLDRATDAATRLTADGLPPASADYWEVPETRTTLATSAVLLAGLRSAGRLYSALGETGRAELSRAAADRLERATLAAFAGRGFPRRLGGGAASVDLGVSLLLRPFAGVDSEAVRAAWRSAPRAMGRPAGGLAPGGSWPRDGLSWTPTVATYALVAACQDPAEARRWLRWLDAHRTAVGALPEKVRADGAPASVAPLAWTAAAVVIAADQLQRGCGPS